MDTWDSRLYDMVLNIKTITVDDAIEILVDLVKKTKFCNNSGIHKDNQRPGPCSQC